MKKKDLEQFHEILNTTAKDSASSMSFKAQDNATQNIHFHLNSTEANAAQNAIKREIEIMDSETSNVYLNQLLRWFQVRFTENTSQIGDKRIIENITKTPLKVVFAKEDIKQNIIRTSGFNKPWQELAYIVDVEVLRLSGHPKVYKILQFLVEL